MRLRLLRIVLATSACGLLAATATAHAAGRTTVADTQPAWATPANLARPADSSERMAFSVWLGWRDPAGADATPAGLYDPSSPTYKRWMTPAEFRPRYSPSQAQVDAVRPWLGDAGFDIVDVPKNRLFVTASGTVDQVEQTFDVHENL